MSREAERTGFKRREEELVGIEQWLEMNKCSIKNGEGLTMQTSHIDYSIGYSIDYILFH